MILWSRDRPGLSAVLLRENDSEMFSDLPKVAQQNIFSEL